MKRLLGLCAGMLLAGALALEGCATNPVTGRREFSLVSPGQELRIGREGHDAIVREYGVYDDPALQAYVDSMGQALARVSHQPELRWHFTLLDDPTVNAFALPGGYIYITRGILAHLNSEAQLAGVLGHEIAHVTARHSAQRITHQQVAGLGFGLAMIFAPGFRPYGDAAQTALELMFLKYGRDDETQADELGVGYALKAGYEPREVPATYAMLRRVGERAGQRLPAFLSTHPDPGDREIRTRALAQQVAVGKKDLIVGHLSHLRRLDGVVFGDDPRQGYFLGRQFFHPELRFQMHFPAGWRTQNGREAVLAVEPSQRAGMQLTLSDTSFAPSDYVRELERTGRITASRGGAEDIGGFPSWVGQVQVVGRDGARQTLAAAFIRKSRGEMFQVIGRSNVAGDALEAEIFRSARSFATLTDPTRLAAEPDRVGVVGVSQSGSFQEVVEGLGVTGPNVDDVSILNNILPDDPVARGQSIKILRRGKR